MSAVRYDAEEKRFESGAALRALDLEIET